MRTIIFAWMAVTCQHARLVTSSPAATNSSPSLTQKITPDSTSWQWFLQHLPETNGPVLDYTGRTVNDASKAYRTINYDVGTRDLQQCADALMRLRAEYLFAQQRLDEISFHFTSGHAYSFIKYCAGIRPVVNGNSVSFLNGSPVATTRKALRSYLNIVYAYAGSISLAKELKNTTELETGTVVITPGSPGHCFIITDESISSSGEKLYKLVEGYTPAQSIYVLRNLTEPSLGYWHRLKSGTITTASYRFTQYQLKKFE